MRAGLSSTSRQCCTGRSFLRRHSLPRRVDHVNEQWPEFWNHLFGQNGYRALDLIRTQTWKNPDLKYWYRQNMFLFVLEDLIQTNPVFLEATRCPDDLMLVHRSVLHHQMGLRSILKQLPKSIWDAGSRRLKIIFK